MSVRMVEQCTFAECRSATINNTIITFKRKFFKKYTCTYHGCTCIHLKECVCVCVCGGGGGVGGGLIGQNGNKYY